MKRGFLILLADVPPTSDADCLTRELEALGVAARDVKILKDWNGRPRGAAFCKVDTSAEADQAVKTLKHYGAYNV